MVFIGEESSERRVNAYIPKYISMVYYIMFLWIPGRDGSRSKITGNFLVNARHAIHRFNRSYHVKIKHIMLQNVVLWRMMGERQEAGAEAWWEVLITEEKSRLRGLKWQI